MKGGGDIIQEGTLFKEIQYLKSEIVRMYYTCLHAHEKGHRSKKTYVLGFQMPQPLYCILIVVRNMYIFETSLVNSQLSSADY